MIGEKKLGSPFRSTASLRREEVQVFALRIDAMLLTACWGRSKTEDVDVDHMRFHLPFISVLLFEVASGMIDNTSPCVRNGYGSLGDCISSVRNCDL